MPISGDFATILRLKSVYIRNEQAIDERENIRSIPYISKELGELWPPNAFSPSSENVRSCCMQKIAELYVIKLCHTFGSLSFAVFENGHEKFGAPVPNTWAPKLPNSGNFMTRYKCEYLRTERATYKRKKTSTKSSHFPTI